MTPLGWASRTKDKVSLLCADGSLDAKARLECQSRLVRDGVTLFPLSPNSTATLDDCRSWTEENRQTICTWLDDKRGLAQYTLAFNAPVPPSVTTSWLRARAALNQAREASLAMIRDTAETFVAPLGAREWRLRSGRFGPVLEALAPHTVVPPQYAFTAAGNSLRGWSLSLVGPLPAYGFTPESNPA